jgi:hypothetical protein
MQGHSRIILSGLFLSICLFRFSAFSSAPIFPGNVEWDSPSNDPSGHMPIGNGDVTASVWAEANNGVFMYLQKADIFGENDSAWDAPTPKMGKLGITFTGASFGAQSFSQKHNTDSGAVEISSGSAGSQIRMKIWSDANMPVIHITMESDKQVSVQCALETWRTETVQADGQTGVISYYRFGTPFRWDSYLPHGEIDRIYGCKIGAPDGWSVSGRTISGSIGTQPVTINVTVLNIVSPEPQQWLDSVKKLHDQCLEVPVNEAYEAHCEWWKEFYSRSWIHCSGFDEADKINTYHACQRFVNACAGRSRVPIHFNGTIFSVGEGGNPDYKKWGGAYWMCNTRCVYWPMLETGDWDQMQSLFYMYGRPEVQEANVKQAYEEFQIPGGYIHEIVNRTGCAYQDAWKFPDYQWRYFSSGLEYLSMAMDYWSMSGDDELLKTNIIPTAYNLVLFYKNFGQIGGDGKLHFNDMNALETYWRANDPPCDIGGIMWVTRLMLQLDGKFLPDTAKELFVEMQGLLPKLPMATDGSGTRILPTANGDGPVNVENPELYCVFPYRLFSTGKPGLDTGRCTWDNRVFGKPLATSWGGFWQHGIHATYLGWADSAKVEIINRLYDTRGWRFPTFFTYGDYPPCQAFAGVAQKVINAALIQADDGKILLFPAWPKDWDVEFKLHTLEQTSVDVKYKDGEITYLSVIPAERYNDIEVMNGASLPANKIAGSRLLAGLQTAPSLNFEISGANSRIIIDPEYSGQWSFRVVDCAGRSVRSAGVLSGKSVIKTNDLPAGVYMCIVNTAKGATVKKSFVIYR